MKRPLSPLYFIPLMSGLYFASGSALLLWVGWWHYGPALALAALSTYLGQRTLTVLLKANSNTEAALREHRTRLEALTSNIPGLVFQLQKKPNGDLASLYSSKESCSDFGLGSEEGEATVFHCIRHLHPDDRDSFFASMNLSAQRMSHWNWEGRLAVCPGEVKWINVRAVPRRVDNSIIWDGIILNISLSKLREEESSSNRELLEKLSGHIQRAREEERTKISREIHDELGGILTTLKMDIGWLGKRLTDAALLERTRTMAQLTKEALDSARRISADLRPGALDNLGLVAAMEEHAQAVLGRRGITYHFTPPPQEPKLDDQKATAMFRIFQEALTNIVRHARASEVDISFALLEDAIEIRIRDNGIGIPMDQLQQQDLSYGILGMRERAKQLGGELDIWGRHGHGTEIFLRVPHHQPTLSPL